MAFSAFARFGIVFALGIGALFVGVGLLKLLAPSSDPAASILEAMWWSWGRVADPGSGAQDTGTGVRAAEIVTTLSGVVLFALLLGFVSDSVQAKIADLRKGKSLVVEHDHTLILGFNDKAVSIIKELAEANESRGDSCIVILSERDKEEVVDSLLEHFGAPKLRTTRIVVRHGSAFSPHDLLNVRAQDARSIIVLSDDGSASQGDVRVVKTVLALTRGLGTRLRGHIAAELLDLEHKDVVTSIDTNHIEVVVARDFLGRLLVQTARQTGLAQVYSMLLSFDGDEFYLLPPPANMAGKSFGEIWSQVSQGIVVGYAPAARQTGQVHAVVLNPSDDTIVGPNDRIAILLEDDSVVISPKALPISITLPRGSLVRAEHAPEHIFVLGFHDQLPLMLSELDQYVAPSTRVTILSQLEREVAIRGLSRVIPSLANLTVTIVQGDPTAKSDLLPVCALGFDSAIVLADASIPHNADDTDARTLMSVILVRSLASRNPRIISEIRNPKTKELAAVADVTDFVVSDELVSGLLAQVSENRDLSGLWDDLCSAEGSEIYLKAGDKYIQHDEQVTFADLMGRARARGEIAIGYAQKALERDPSKAYGIVLNPRNKTEKFPFTTDDRLIVIAEDER